MSLSRHASPVAILLCLALLGGCSLLPRRDQSAAPPGTATSPAAASDDASLPSPAKKRGFWDMVFFWRKPGPPSAQPLVPSGKVYLVNEPGGFVVVEGTGATGLAEGTILSTLREGRVVSTCRIAAERRPPFTIAEIITGRPSPGDALYLVR